MGVERKHSKSNQGGKIRTENQNWAMPEGRTNENAKTAADLRYPTTPIPKTPPKFTKRPATYKIHNWDTWRPISMTTSQRDTPTPQEKYQISDYCWHLEPILLLHLPRKLTFLTSISDGFLAPAMQNDVHVRKRARTPGKTTPLKLWKSGDGHFVRACAVENQHRISKRHSCADETTPSVWLLFGE